MPAVALAERVAEEVGCRAGGKVGYTIGFENETSQDTLIKYMTDGVLVNERGRDEQLLKYFCIILDEAHERSLNTDTLLPMLLETCQLRQNFKLIVCNASINSSQFVRYMKDKFAITPPVIRVPGRLYPVEIVYVMRPRLLYPTSSAVEVVLHIIESRQDGDILVFCAGQRDINTICTALRGYTSNATTDMPLLVVPIHRNLPDYKQKVALGPTPAGSRKVVVATNIAETSLTIDGIVFVVDMGTVMKKFFEPLTGFTRLSQYPISAGSAVQRAGRA
ncbi:ATP-dependent RNA helicase DHX8 isoform 2, partial [Aphelenchoides avenae]